MTWIEVRWLRHSLLAVCLAGALATAGCGRRSNAQEGESAAGRGVPVLTTAAERGRMAESVTVTGTIRALNDAGVSAQVSGRVLEVRVREGDRVTAGQVLVTLDQTQVASRVRQAEAGVEAARARLEAAQRRLEVLELGAREEERAIARSRLEQAASALRTAEADLNRLRGLFEQGAVSRQQLDSAQVAYDTARTNRDAARQTLDLTERGARPEEIDVARREVEAAAAGLQQARAMHAEAREFLTYTEIRSPVTGVVYERNVEPGEIASPGAMDPLLRVADLSDAYYEATVPERVALSVQPGQRVELTLQVDGGRQVPGVVERVVPVADPRSRDFLVRVRLEDGRGLARPGMFARGAIVVRESPDSVVIPKDAVIEREGRPIVFVVADGKAHLRQVELGIANTVQIEVRAGVSAGEMVVVVGSQGLQDGDEVMLRQAGGE